MIYIASDHVGIGLKQFLMYALKEQGVEVHDLGPDSKERVDYTVFTNTLCGNIIQEDDLGILICGTGIGMSMMANRHKGVRAAVCTHEYMAEMTRKHNNANILCLGSRMTGEELALTIVNRFINIDFEGGRHQARVQQLDN